MLKAESLFSLEGKTVLLTGASGHLGKKIAETVLTNGAKLIAMGRSLIRTHACVEKWRDRYGNKHVDPVQVDMYDLPELAKVLDYLVGMGPIDVLINNAHDLNEAAGFNTPSGTIENATPEQWDKHFAAVHWAAMTTQKIGAGMKDRGRGSIINISTMYAEVAPNPQLYEGTEFMNPPGYSAAKAALLALTRYTASFWGPHGIRANAILPGPFPKDVQNPTFLKRLKERTCLRRVGKPQDLAGVLLFLASDASSYVTGQAISVDGGWAVT